MPLSLADKMQRMIGIALQCGKNVPRIVHIMLTIEPLDYAVEGSMKKEEDRFYATCNSDAELYQNMREMEETIPEIMETSKYKKRNAEEVFWDIFEKRTKSAEISSLFSNFDASFKYF